MKSYNIYNSKFNPKINIEIGTIHSVKGETHKATLLLETYFNKKYDVKEIIDFLKGRYDSKEAGKPITRYILKLAYVAMSRPTHLLGVALHSDHLNELDIIELGNNNWNIVYA